MIRRLDLYLKTNLYNLVLRTAIGIWLLLMLVNMRSHQHLNHQNNDLLFFSISSYFSCLYIKKKPNFLRFFFLALSRCDTLLLIDHCCLSFFCLACFFSSTPWFVFFIYGTALSDVWTKRLFSSYTSSACTYIFLVAYFEIYSYIYIHSDLFFVLSSRVFFFMSCVLIYQLRFFLPK